MEEHCYALQRRSNKPEEHAQNDSLRLECAETPAQLGEPHGIESWILQQLRLVG